MKRSAFTPPQLADLLNFVLSRQIDVFVIKTWTGHQCWQVELWCEYVLHGEGMLVKRKCSRSQIVPLVLRGLMEAKAKAKGAGK